jgi:hypothetical protein
MADLDLTDLEELPIMIIGNAVRTSVHVNEVIQLPWDCHVVIHLILVHAMLYSCILELKYSEPGW